VAGKMAELFFLHFGKSLEYFALQLMSMTHEFEVFFYNVSLSVWAARNLGYYHFYQQINLVLYPVLLF